MVGLAGDAGQPKVRQEQRRTYMESMREGFLADKGAMMPSVFGQVVLEHVAGAGERPLAQEGAVNLDEALERLGGVVAQMWAAETSQKRRNLWGRLQGWAAAQHIPVTAEAAALFVLATSVTPQGQLNYAKALSGVFRHLGLERQPLLSLAGTRGGGSCQASSADRKGNAGPVGERTSTRREVGGSGVLEDGVKVGRGTEADFPTVHLDRDGRGDHRLGDDTEASSGGPVCSLKMGGDPGRSGGGDRSVGGGALSVRTTDGCHIGKAGGSVAERPGHEGLHGALGEARGGRRPDAGARGRKVDVNVPGITSSQAHRRRGRGVVHNPPVCVEPGEYCQGIGDLACDEAAVRIGTQHSLVRRGKRTRLPSTWEEKASPLHVSGVPVMDVVGLRRRLDVEPRRRFDEVWKMTFSPEVGKAGRSSGRSAFSEEHAGELASFGIARKATGPGEANNVPFTVLEEKPEGLRQRFILWTKDANSWLEERYTAQVPLHHISRYLDQVREECGSTRDFRTGFYAIEIPEEARSFFRFQTEGGSWFELCRLPMGHVCAPEIMHTLAAAAAGDPAYVLPEWRVRGVRVDVFIDNIRYTGEAGMVLAAMANLDAAADDFCLTWKPADSFTAETKYTFLGVDFDHRESEVKVSAKICRKLQGVDMDNVTAGQLESMGGRLMHASAVAGETPGKYWFALKFLRRLANNLNAGRRLVGDRVHVPVSISTELRERLVRRLRDGCSLRLMGRSRSSPSSSMPRRWDGEESL